MSARPLQKLETTVDWEARCRALTQRDAERARKLDELKREHHRAVLRYEAALKTAERRLEDERQLREDAERNAKRFHAMLLQERIRKL